MLLIQRVSTTTDDAGVTIHKRVLPPPPIPGPYSLQLPRHLPSLSALCLHILAEFPDQLRLPVRLHYRSEITRLTLRHIDPRLWATLVQIYDGLPDSLRVYRIPLNDIHLPLLQRVPSTSHFSLLTILDLPACPSLTDDAISALKLLHSLVAFDASATSLSSYAVKVLARTLIHTQYDASRRGPWALRILRLRNCINIDNSVCSHIDLFPLLSVVDLRGTRCTRPPAAFRQASTSESILYHPSPLLPALTFLQSTSPLHSSQNLFYFHISTLDHPPRPSKMSTVTPQNSFVVVSATKLITGDAETLRVDSTQPPVPRAYVTPNAEVTSHNCFCKDESGEDKHRISANDALSPPLVADPSPALSPGPSHLDPLASDDNPASTASFYHRGRTREYSADAYYSRVRAEVTLVNKKSSTFLMRYRDPPPWSLLESASTHNKTYSEQSAPYPIKKKDDHKQAALAALRRSATRRVTAVQDTTPHPSPVTQSKNPFRKTISDIEAPRLLDITASGASVKPLKPISAVKVPSLPSELRCQSSASQLLPRKHDNNTNDIKIQTQMNTVGDRGSTGSMDPAVVNFKPRGATYLGPLKRSSSTRGEPKKKGRFSDRVNLDEGQVSSAVKDVKKTRSFDWSVWAAHDE